MDSNEASYFRITEEHGRKKTFCKLCGQFWRESLNFRLMRLHLSNEKYAKKDIKICLMVTKEIQDEMIKLLEKENLSSQKFDILGSNESFRSPSSTTPTGSSASTVSGSSDCIATGSSVYTANDSSIFSQYNSFSLKKRNSTNIGYRAGLFNNLQKKMKSTQK